MCVRTLLEGQIHSLVLTGKGDMLRATWLEESSARRLGVGIDVRRRPTGEWDLLAVRAGLLADDDEVVAHLVSRADGDHWVVPAVPTPRGQVVIRVLRGLHRALTGDLPVQGAPWRAGASGVPMHDDAELLRSELGVDDSRAEVLRLRCWRTEDGPWVLVVPEASEDEGGWVGTLLHAHDGCWGQVLVPRHGEWALHHGGLRPFAEAVGPPSEQVARLVREAASALTGR